MNSYSHTQGNSVGLRNNLFLIFREIVFFQNSIVRPKIFWSSLVQLLTGIEHVWLVFMLVSQKILVLILNTGY